MLRDTSALNSLMACAAPASPATDAANPKGRPTNTKRAPNASAFKTSLPRRSLFWHPRFVNDPPILWLRNLLTRLLQEEPYSQRAESKRAVQRTGKPGHG